MKVQKSPLAAILLAGLLALCACHRKEPVNNLPIKQYELHGKVMRLKPQDHAAIINGQEIKGWMGAMTMEYPVKPDEALQKLRPGEQISATVFVQGTDYWISDIRREAPSK